MGSEKLENLRRLTDPRLTAAHGEGRLVSTAVLPVGTVLITAVIHEVGTRRGPFDGLSGRKVLTWCFSGINGKRWLRGSCALIQELMCDLCYCQT